MKRLLVVDSEAASLKLAEALLAGRYQVRTAETAAQALELMSTDAFDLVLAELGCLDAPGRSLDAAAFVAAAKGAAVVYAAALDCPEPVLHALRDGASGFVSKPYVPAILESALRKASARAAIGRPVPELRETECGNRYGNARPGIPPGILGSSQAMECVRERIALYASSDAPVLILGESGTGKELAAAEIHKRSARGQRGFFALDCASIPEALAESELFGTVRGAFTGATERKGVFEQAHGGTIFLDEVGELPLAVQAKLLRTLESRQACRLGSLSPKDYDVRMVSATNARLFGDAHHFRLDLLNRLNTLVLIMPPLRNHLEDIPELTMHFLEAAGGRHELDPEAMDKLRAWHWPGNVRELRNTIIRASVLAGRRRVIDAACVETHGDAAWGGLQGMLM